MCDVALRRSERELSRWLRSVLVSRVGREEELTGITAVTVGDAGAVVATCPVAAAERRLRLRLPLISSVLSLRCSRVDVVAVELE